MLKQGPKLVTGGGSAAHSQTSLPPSQVLTPPFLALALGFVFWRSAALSVKLRNLCAALFHNSCRQSTPKPHRDTSACGGSAVHSANMTDGYRNGPSRKGQGANTHSRCGAHTGAVNKQSMIYCAFKGLACCSVLSWLVPQGVCR